MELAEALVQVFHAMVLRAPAPKLRELPSSEEWQSERLRVACISSHPSVLPSPEEIGKAAGFPVLHSDRRAILSDKGAFTPLPAIDDELNRFHGVRFGCSKDCRRAEAHLLKSIDVSLEQGAHIIIANELAYPVGPDGISNKFRRTIQNRSRQGGALILPGTYHDIGKDASWFNILPIFYPGGRLSGADVKAHLKVNTASKCDERVREPFEKIAPYYLWNGLRILPLICLDVFDFSIVMSYARSVLIGRGYRALDLVIVPSYSGRKRDLIEGLCKAISYLLAVPVALVDSQAGRAHRCLVEGAYCESALRGLRIEHDDLITVYDWPITYFRSLQSTELEERASSQEWNIIVKRGRVL
jgi:hypothetical protein